jgi:glycosyltransferase involved in cell wall biosynthesis
MSNCIIVYQYYYPDNVVSARHFTDLAESLCSTGWDVQVFTGNRFCRKSGKIVPRHEVHNGVNITRSWYPPFSHSKNVGRLLNTLYLSIDWGIRLIFSCMDIVIFGTNPQFLYYIIPFLRFFRPNLPIVIWGFDLYPEIIISDGIKMPKILKSLLDWWAGVSYRHCDILVDIGPCMRKRFLAYHPKARLETIIPWALNEPISPEEPDNNTRFDLFGNTEFGILYSGTIAKAHQFNEFIFLARELRKRSAQINFCFAGNGNCYHELKKMVTPEDSNITFRDFVEERYLPMRLAAADMHMISLRHGWEGIVVPSKFFGSLASGRPLLYCGTPDSCIAEFIREKKIGFVITMDTIKTIADCLEELSHNEKKLRQMQVRSFLFYNEHFTKEMQCMKWNRILNDFLPSKN